jgi:glutathione S-transferase
MVIKESMLASSTPANITVGFDYIHSEQPPSAISHYNDEIRRILGVTEDALEGKQWLVGDKCILADIAFAPGNDRVDALLKISAEQKFDGVPNVKTWHERLMSRPSCKKATETKAKLIDDQSLQWNGMKGVNNM